MTTNRGSSAKLVRWEQPQAPQPFVLEGEILGETPEGQIRLLHAVLEALVPASALVAESFRNPAARLLSIERNNELHRLAEQASALLRLALPYSEGDLRGMLEILVDEGVLAMVAIRLLTQLVRHVERYAAEHGLPASLRPPLLREREKLRPFPGANDWGRLGVRLERLLAPDAAGMPEPSEAWARVIRSSLASMNAESHAKWRALLAHGAHIDQTRPSTNWRRAANEQIERIGIAAFREHALAWLTAAAEPFNKVLSEQNGIVLKGLTWLCSTQEDADLARALANLAEALLRWLPTRLDWRGLKAGNACLNALATMPGPEPLTQLSRLVLRLKGKQLQTSVGRAIEAAIERRGMPREDLGELTAPTHGLDSDGVLRGAIGDAGFAIAVTASADVEWRWYLNGVQQHVPPASVRSDHANELRALRATAAELRRTLASQRARLERFFLCERRWRHADWKARYCDHPLLRQLTSALIWQIQSPGTEPELGLLVGDRFVGADGRRLTKIADDGEVRLWHPCGATPAVVEAWRSCLAALGIGQPFKQVEREVYRLTAQELAAGASARFAGRILRQQQLNALCRERGWQYAVRGPWHGGPPRAIRALPDWNVQAEFWLRVPPEFEAAGRGGPPGLTSTGMYPFLTSDELRFTTGGGERLLSDMPVHVVSEILRDIDLFVSATELRGKAARVALGLLAGQTRE